MGKPQIAIDVDDATGAWSVDGMPMLLVPRHFFLNNHLAVEAALGRAKYAELLFDAGHKSAFAWCEYEARTHSLQGAAVFHHYMRRLSQRGWGQFTVEALEPQTGRARVRVAHSIFVAGRSHAPGKRCYMFRGWFPGALQLVGMLLGCTLDMTCEELQCAAENRHDFCIFETEPVSGY